MKTFILTALMLVSVNVAYATDYSTVSIPIPARNGLNLPEQMMLTAQIERPYSGLVKIYNPRLVTKLGSLGIKIFRPNAAAICRIIMPDFSSLETKVTFTLSDELAPRYTGSVTMNGNGVVGGTTPIIDQTSSGIYTYIKCSSL